MCRISFARRESKQRPIGTSASTPGAALTIEYAAAVDKDAQTATESAMHWAKTFDQSFAQAKLRWEERWQAAFTPGNEHFSGHLPTLLTGDAKIRRVYYEGALTSQLLCRTNLPVSKRVFVTAGPQWATTLMYFWDTEMWANSWAMLEPVTMKEHLINGWRWISTDAMRWTTCPEEARDRGTPPMIGRCSVAWTLTWT